MTEKSRQCWRLFSLLVSFGGLFLCNVSADQAFYVALNVVDGFKVGDDVGIGSVVKVDGQPLDVVALIFCVGALVRFWNQLILLLPLAMSPHLW